MCLPLITEFSDEYLPFLWRLIYRIFVDGTYLWARILQSAATRRSLRSRGPVMCFAICCRSKSFQTTEWQLQLSFNQRSRWHQEKGFKFSIAKTPIEHFFRMKALFDSSLHSQSVFDFCQWSQLVAWHTNYTTGNSIQVPANPKWFTRLNWSLLGSRENANAVISFALIACRLSRTHGVQSLDLTRPLTL